MTAENPQSDVFVVRYRIAQCETMMTQTRRFIDCLSDLLEGNPINARELRDALEDLRRIQAKTQFFLEEQYHRVPETSSTRWN